MTSHRATDDPASTGIDSVADYESLRDRADVPYHEESDVVDGETVAAIADLPDLAAVGVTNRDGDLLFRRLTDTCSWKIPVATVGPDDDFARSIVEHVEETIGFTLELESVAGVWDIGVRTGDGEQTASRGFVTFGAAPVSGEYDMDAATAAGEFVEEAGWFDERPTDADEIPGTDLFLD